MTSSIPSSASFVLEATISTPTSSIKTGQVLQKGEGGEQLFPPLMAAVYACLDNSQDSDHSLLNFREAVERRSIALQSEREM